jgi:hypothetical protein
MLFARVVACRSHALSSAFRVCRASRHALLARISRVDQVGRAVSARDNKLFSIIITHVNKINSSGYIF